MANIVTVARAKTNAAFRVGTVPAPYYLHILARANARAMGASRAVAPGTAGTPGGTVSVQRFTAQHKVARGAKHAPYTPAATRHAWRTRTVQVHTHKHGWRKVTVHTQGAVPVQ